MNKMKQFLFVFVSMYTLGSASVFNFTQSIFYFDQNQLKIIIIIIILIGFMDINCSGILFKNSLHMRTILAEQIQRFRFSQLIRTYVYVDRTRV